MVTTALCVQNVCFRLAMSQATWPWPVIFPKFTASRLQRGWWGWQTVGKLKLDIALSAVLNVNYFLLGTIKVVRKLLIFLAFLPEDSHFFPPSHHRLMPGHIREGTQRPHKKWQPKLDCYQQRAFKKHREKSGFDQCLSWGSMEGD